MLRSLQAAAAVITVTLTGCGALPQSIELEGDQSKVVDEQITVTVQETPTFMFTTPRKAQVDAGIAVWQDPDHAPTWQRVSKANRVPDFTRVLRDKFISQAEQRSDASFVKAEQSEPFEDSTDFTRLTTRYNTPYILELRTKFGSFAHGPLSWDTMFLNYFADATLVRQADGKPVWRSTCKVRDDDSDRLSLPLDDLYDGTGDAFRTAADTATSLCSQQLVNAFISALR